MGDKIVMVFCVCVGGGSVSGMLVSKPTYLLIDCSCIHWANSCVWIFGVLLINKLSLHVAVLK
jgi:hypothetical protein